MKVVWSPTAVRDLTQLRAYIAEDDPVATGRAGRAILDAVKRLRQLPSIGQAVVRFTSTTKRHPCRDELFGARSLLTL